MATVVMVPLIELNAANVIVLNQPVPVPESAGSSPKERTKYIYEKFINPPSKCLVPNNKVVWYDSGKYHATYNLPAGVQVFYRGCA